MTPRIHAANYAALLAVIVILLPRADLFPSVKPVSASTVPTPARTVLTSRSAVDRVDARELARELLTPASFRCLDKIVERESRWRNAENPTSTAKGIGQLLASTWRNIGMTPTDNVNAQLIATLAYISRHYGSGGPCAAWRFWQSHDYF